ncbi:FeoA family protein [Serpentinicella alkaliphila]|uniref:Ferrous iron transport protein A n=1 Tax=Serpentinicella alkaliphila TaxID=1734049 RepID=A0A4R2TJH9_9FIRM|nr:FeoA family protein [Serpentinicella alkaliphila]QUH24826.1 ferrous iron transport protein A [Serpentinicella alkaliphila]TCQ03471.1 ferrous iron transport protein A [Serpentinicella alkaliphila]
MLLYKLKTNSKCIIEKLPMGGLLTSLGVREGIVVSVKSKQPLGGPIVIDLGLRDIAIAKDVAEHIQVKEVY